MTDLLPGHYEYVRIDLDVRHGNHRGTIQAPDRQGMRAMRSQPGRRAPWAVPAGTFDGEH